MALGTTIVGSKTIGLMIPYKSRAGFLANPAMTLDINSQSSNYNIWTQLGEPSGPIDVTLNVNATVYSTNNNIPAVSSGALHPDSTLVINVAGGRYIYGKGGNGGTGGVGIGLNNSQPGSNGYNGGHAINLDGVISSFTLNNANGYIFGGGGGGGGGGADDGQYAGSPYPTIVSCGGGGGGAGAASVTYPANGGGGGAVYSGDIRKPGTAGASSTTPSNGQAYGNPGIGGYYDTNTKGANGGSGANWGENGGNGIQAKSLGGIGGAGGSAISLGGNTVILTGSTSSTYIKGAIA